MQQDKKPEYPIQQAFTFLAIALGMLTLLGLLGLALGSAGMTAIMIISILAIMVCFGLAVIWNRHAILSGSFSNETESVKLQISTKDAADSNP